MSAVTGDGNSLLQVRNLWKRFPIKRGLACSSERSTTSTRSPT